MVISPDTALRRTPEVRYRLVDGEAVVVRQQAGEVLGLNEVGSRLFHLLDGERSVAALVEEVLPDFQVSREALTQDALAFLGELLKKGLVVAAESAGPGGAPP